MFARVADPDRPSFQLRPGEEGISVFSTVDPLLAEEEILEAFRPGSIIRLRSREEIESKGLSIVPVLGDETLPVRLQQAHAEIRPGVGMSRSDFKRALKELE